MAQGAQPLSGSMTERGMGKGRKQGGLGRGRGACRGGVAGNLLSPVFPPEIGHPKPESPRKWIVPAIMGAIYMINGSETCG